MSEDVYDPVAEYQRQPATKGMLKQLELRIEALEAIEGSRPSRDLEEEIAELTRRMDDLSVGYQRDWEAAQERFQALEANGHVHAPVSSTTTQLGQAVDDLLGVTIRQRNEWCDRAQKAESQVVELEASHKAAGYSFVRPGMPDPGGVTYVAMNGKHYEEWRKARETDRARAERAEKELAVTRTELAEREADVTALKLELQGYVVNSDERETLKAELVDECAEHELTKQQRHHWLKECERLREQVTYFESSRTYLKLSADAERLDWLDADVKGQDFVGWTYGIGGLSNCAAGGAGFRTVREAIDAARKETQADGTH